MRSAVLGSPISHSLSPVLHSAAYGALGLTWWRYEAIECDEAGLPALLDRCGPDWAGLSLTMPLKRTVLPLLDRIDPPVAEVGAANTVLFAAAQRLGYNTDVPGMVRALGEHGVGAVQAVAGTASGDATPGPSGQVGPALILGGGATACAALAALRDLGERSVAVAVREPARAAGLIATAERLGVAVQLRPSFVVFQRRCDDVNSTLGSTGDQMIGYVHCQRSGISLAGSPAFGLLPRACSMSAITRGRARSAVRLSKPARWSSMDSSCCSTRRRCRSSL